MGGCLGRKGGQDVVLAYSPPPPTLSAFHTNSPSPSFTHVYAAVFNPSPPTSPTPYYTFHEDGTVKDSFDPVDWAGTSACLIQYKVTEKPVRVEGTMGSGSAKYVVCQPIDVGRRFSVENPGSTGDGGKKGKSKKKWDSAMLSDFCRWRACMAQSTSKPAPKYLCEQHSNLKLFLDARAQGGNVEQGTFPPTCADSNR